MDKLDILLKIISYYEGYVELLGEELNELVGLAHVHGWKSQRYEQGKNHREQISKLKAEFMEKRK